MTNLKRTQSQYFKPVKFRRTDRNEDYLNSASSSTTVYIESDGEEEIRLNREISDLYQQIKIKKDRLEKIKINKAVANALKQQRRETKRWLPTLENVSKCKESIVKNLSGDSSDSDWDEDLTLPTAKELMDELLKENNKNTCNLNNVD